MVPTLLALCLTPPIPPGLPPWSAPPGLVLTIAPTGKPGLSAAPLVGTIKNVSDTPYAVWYCPYANVRWFARRVGGGPILTQKDWTRDFPSMTRDSNFPAGLLKGEAGPFGYGPPAWMKSLPRGRYDVWMLYCERGSEGIRRDLAPVRRHPAPKGTPWRSPAMQLVSNTVARDLP